MIFVLEWLLTLSAFGNLSRGNLHPADKQHNGLLSVGCSLLLPNAQAQMQINNPERPKKKGPNVILHQFDISVIEKAPFCFRHEFYAGLF